ncbi:MAG TPA: hypothetical protein PKC76_02895 [Saprospiraceae bacterium]|nr:hypothetical protein [Saprospiraceae bacterium]HMP23049.1 hypothetical protein [Saprospiraceae bacterium]
MSNKYHILRNQKQPSSEDIARHKDFDALLAKYQTTPSAKRPQGAIVRQLTYAAVVLAAAASVLLVFRIFTAPAEATLTEQEYFAQLPVLHPPIEALQPTYSTQKVNATTGGAYDTPAGARIVVPTQAFMNDRGELIEGDVNLHYRQLSDYVDFFLAGVPMTYDSANTRYQLESAGMVELYAEQNGTLVMLAPGKTIEVALVTEIWLPEGAAAPRFNVYKLDTTARAWIFQQITNLQLIEDLDYNASNDINNNNNPVNALRSKYASEIAAIESAAASRLRAIEVSVPAPTEPLKPLAANSNRPVIEPTFLEDATIENNPDITQNEQERLRKTLQGTFWQIAPSSAYDERDFQTDWENIRLRQLNNRDYELTATKGNRTLRLVINPVLTGAAYQRALTQYEQDFANWQQQMSQREAQLKAQKEALQNEIAQQRRAAEQQFNEQMAALGADPAEWLRKKRVTNRFAINSLGLWSCNRIIPAAEQQLQGKLEDQFGNAYEQEVAYLVNKRHNTIYRYYLTKDNPVRFDAQADNLLWVVAPDHKIAVLKPADFKKASQEKGKTIKINLLEQPVQKEADARAVLSWQ